MSIRFIYIKLNSYYGLHYNTTFENELETSFKILVTKTSYKVKQMNLTMPMLFIVTKLDEYYMLMANTTFYMRLNYNFKMLCPNNDIQSKTNCFCNDYWWEVKGINISEKIYIIIGIILIWDLKIINWNWFYRSQWQTK